MTKLANIRNQKQIKPLDSTDRKLLNALQKDAGQSNLALAAHVGLSPAPCSRRVKRLHEDGFIQRVVAVVNPLQSGESLTAFIGVELDRQRGDVLAAFEKRITKMKEVQQCYFISGESDYLLVVTVKDMATFTAFIRSTLSREPAVKRYRTSFVAERIKCDTAIPFDEK